MDHAQIEENNLIDRYVRGTLPVDLRAEFEEHFLDCPDCVQQLNLATHLREGLRLSAAEMAAAAPPRDSPSVGVRKVFAWRWAPAAAAAALVLALTPSFVLVRQLGSARSELARNQAELSAAHSQAEGMEQAGAAVYILSPVRGEGAPNRIAVPPAPALTVLTLESDFSRFAAYRAILRNDRGQVVWQKDQLHPSSPDAIGIVLSASFLSAPGLYKLALDGQDAQGRYLPAATFSFSASPAR
ncbi:MAG TPA: zf-HC2 domain-containing protein [Bryobacteraceae bacterium]|nr:zf-HC2 domain-containing protein [Bryobacteraceae bacterium]